MPSKCPLVFFTGMTILVNYGRTKLFCSFFVLLFVVHVQGHEGPDPLGHWLGHSDRVKDGKLMSRLGPDGSLSFKPAFIKDKEGESLLFEGPKASCLLAKDLKSVINSLPSNALTLSAWISVSTPRQWGGILGVIQDNGDREKGWVLGYNESTFYFGLATEGADDGDGKMTYLKAKINYELGKLYHLTATYDGNKTEIFKVYPLFCFLIYNFFLTNILFSLPLFLNYMSHNKLISIFCP